MKPILTEDKKLTAELYKREETQLKAARAIGQLLYVMHQHEGVALVEAVDAILDKFSGTSEAEPDPTGEEPGE